MIIFYLFWAFFIANLLGYGGGPASIPLNFEEVVQHFHWLSKEEFSNMLALANALPGPIATKSPLMSATACSDGPVSSLLLSQLCCLRPSRSFCCSS